MSETAGGEPCGHTRIAGLDAWRARLMLGGLLVHGSFRLPEHPLATFVGAASEAFRMGAFFAISAFLAATVLPRRDASKWLRGRVVTLGTPALFGVAVLSPLVWALIEFAPRTPGRAVLPFEWFHLWFLYALIGYCLCLAGVEASDRRLRWLDRLDRSVPGGATSGRIVMLTVALTSAALFGTAAPVLHALLADRYIVAFANLQSVPGYLPMFLFGTVLARCPGIRASVFAARGFAVAVLAASMAGVILLTSGRVGPALADYIHFAVATLCPPAATALILRHALGEQQISPLTQRLADASFTIYVVHLPIAVAFNVSVGRFLPTGVAFMLCVAVAGVLSYGLHRIVVMRSPLLLLLLNGKPFELRLPRWPGSATT